VDLAELGRALPSDEGRRWLVDGLIVAVCIEGEVNPARRAALEGLARGLGVRSPYLDLLPDFQARNTWAIKRGLATRSPDARRMFRRLWQEEGVLGLARAGLFVLGLHRDPQLARRFRALAAMPAGTLGHAVTEHFAARGLTFPGERGGMPERMMHHDLLHVLNGYNTDPAGECELAGFYCGFAGEGAFTFIMTVLATFHLGLSVSPAVVKPAVGAFDPERVLRAFLRGRRLSTDVMGPWDYWALMGLSLDEARERLGIGEPPQRLASAGAPRS
jgi:hypothetical protein